MITEFQILDAEGNVIGEGETDGDIAESGEFCEASVRKTLPSVWKPSRTEVATFRYRVFSADLSGGYQEFERLKELFVACGGTAIQPALFQSPARARQLRVF